MTSMQEIRQWAVSASPVFICGLERAGTSILQVSLSRHPQLFQVRDVYETFAFLRPRSLIADPPAQMTLAYLQGSENARKLKSLAKELAGPRDELSEADLIRTFFWFCAHHVYPGRQPLEKTPAHVRRLPRILELFPNAHVLVCTREPVAIIASYRKRLEKERSMGRGADSWGWLDKTPPELIAHFRSVTNHLREAQQRWPDRIFVAPYDWLTESPETALKEICQFAGIAFVPEILRPKEVPGRKVDVMLSQPITKVDPEIEGVLDAETASSIVRETADLSAIWSLPGIRAA